MSMGRYKHSTTFIPTFGLLLEHATCAANQQAVAQIRLF
jgi:hypothetical protein